MENKILDILNYIRVNKGEEKLLNIKKSNTLRDDLGLDSFDLAELTVRLEVEYDVDVFEGGIISTIGEVIERLNK